jgi:hypothetical protein
MLAACAAMATPAKNAYLVNKVVLFQFLIFTMGCKYTLTIFNSALNEIPADHFISFFTCRGL